LWIGLFKALLFFAEFSIEPHQVHAHGVFVRLHKLAPRFGNLTVANIVTDKANAIIKEGVNTHGDDFPCRKKSITSPRKKRKTDQSSPQMQEACRIIQMQVNEIIPIIREIFHSVVMKMSPTKFPRRGDSHEFSSYL
jgi:hypothetical protein